jgi:hypothetical protein
LFVTRKGVHDVPLFRHKEAPKDYPTIA